jgi:putative ABC transport system permease protein
MGVGSVGRQRQGVSVGQGTQSPAPPERDRVLWQGRRASLFSSARLAAKRLGSSLRLLLAVGVGILVAVVLICTVPLYSGLVSNIQLQAAINGQPPVGRDVEVQVSGEQFSADLRRQEDSSVRPIGAQYLGAFTQPDVTNYLAAENMLLGALNARAFDLQDPNAAEVQFDAFDYAQARPHMRLSPGSVLPRPSQAGTTAPYDALITQQLADDEKVVIGDMLTAVQFGAHDKKIVVRIVGIWSPLNPTDLFWNGRSFDRGGPTPIYPVLLDRDAFTQATSAIPTLSVTQAWVYYTISTHITTANMDTIAMDIGLLRTHLATSVTGPGVSVIVIGDLDQTIHDVKSQLALLGLPLYVVVGQVVGLALLFVVAMAGLLVDAQSAEIATLKSRGASGTQLLGSYALQGLLLGLVAVAVGPWLAALLGLALIHSFVPAATVSAAGASNAYLTGLASPAAVLGPAVAGALLGVAAVIAAVQRAARLDVLAFRREQGRSTRLPFWRRYYVDVGLAIICALGYLELGQFGGVQMRQTLGQTTTSPLLLAAPALLLLAGALLLLRVFPLLVSAGARAASRGRGATGVLAFAQVARSPAGPSRLALLLALGVGLGLFAITFDASLTRNGTDRAAYQVGADLRLTQNTIEVPGDDTRIERQLTSQPGVVGLTPVYHNAVSTTVDEGFTTVDLVAIDPATWQPVAGATSWRSDYADASLDALVAGLRAHQLGAAAADRAGQTGAGTSDHPIWALVSQTFASNLNVRVGDRFALDLPFEVATASFFQVGAIVRDFPTLYPGQAPGGFVVAGLNDALGAITVGDQGSAQQVGPNEYWLKLSTDPARRAALSGFLAHNGSQLNIARVDDRRQLAASIASSPVQAGMRGLLTIGALIAAALAVLGSIVQSALVARQRLVQFAVLRTLGMLNRQLTNLLLGEQIVIYAFGLLSGTVLGLVLVTATLPYLQFSDTTINPAQLGVPPYLLAFDPVRMLQFYAVLLGAFVLGLLVAARVASTAGLGNTLRLGED